MHSSALIGFLDEFRAVTSLQQLTALLARVASHLGFEWAVYALESTSAQGGRRLALVNDYPEPWIERYFREGYISSDPVMRHCQNAVLPVRWEEVQLATSREALVMRDAAEFGLRVGLSAPLFGAHGEHGVLSLATGTELRDAPRRVDDALVYLPLLAGYVHHTLRRVLPEEEGRVAPLSHRERECLLWVAEGKTSWEIGNILGVSERTVLFHLGNACRKLGVNKRQHAVARALLLGILDAPPPVRIDRGSSRA